MVFDLGGVVLGWDPRRAYEQVLPAREVDAFMARIDFAGWNRSHDAGRAYADGERDLIEEFPADAAAIRAYRQHFGRTLTGMVPGTGALLAELGRAGVRLLALTNWSAETFPHAVERFGILRRFEDVLVSGAEGLAKPDPAIFRLALRRFGLEATETVFVDDSPVNVEAARSLGLTGLDFTDDSALRADLVSLGLVVDREPVTDAVFHLADAEAWAVAQASGHYPWSGRGVGFDAEGFVHCSFAHQVPEVLARHYADVPPAELVLVELDPDRMAGSLVVEDLGAGAYPHLFAPLDPSSVVDTHPVPG